MKFTKLSLAALAAIGLATSASAVENVKVDGSIKLWYQTSDTTKGNNATEQTSADGVSTTKDDGLFKKEGAIGDLAAKLRVTGDLTKKTGFGITFYGLTTAGLENNLVTNVAAGSAANANTNGTTQNPYWLGEAYFTYKAGKTIAKIGRQELDTPLAYSETWNVVPNTFEAAVLVNQDIPNTTLVGAFVSRGNGTDDILGKGGTIAKLGTSNANTINADATFSTFGTGVAKNIGTALGTGTYGNSSGKGAWALGAVTTAIPMTTAQLWFYNIQDAAQAYWAQADAKLPIGLGLGAQYAHLSSVGTVDKALKALGTANGVTYDTKTDAYALQATYSIVGIDLSAAYSNVSEGTLGVGNYATSGYDSKIYTASVLDNASTPGEKAIKLGAGYKIAGIDLSASYAMLDYKKNDKGAIYNRTSSQTYKPKELDLVASTKVDEIDLTVAYVNYQDYNASKQDVQAVRVIAGIKF